MKKLEKNNMGEKNKKDPFLAEKKPLVLHIVIGKMQEATWGVACNSNRKKPSTVMKDTRGKP